MTGWQIRMACGWLAILIISTSARAQVTANFLYNSGNTAQSWTAATTWDVVPDGIGDTAQRLTSFSGSGNSRRVNTGAARTLGSILYGDNNEMGNYFWLFGLTATNTLTFNQDGDGPGFAVMRNSSTTVNALNAVLTNTGTIVLADDLHVINNGGSININGGVQLASVITGAGDITFNSNGAVFDNNGNINSTATNSPGSIWLNSSANATTFGTNTYVGDTLVQRGLVAFNFSNTPFGDVGNKVTIGENGAGSAALISRDTSPVNYAITIAAAATDETRTLGSVGDTAYVVSTGNIILNGSLNIQAGGTSTTVVQEYSGVFSGAGGIHKIGPAVANLSGSNTYAGTTTVSTGKLLVSGTHTGGGAYTVNSGAALGGGGTTSAEVSILSGGFVTPGASIGTLTVGSADIQGTLEIEYGNDQIDKLVVAGGGGPLSGDFNGDTRVDAADYVVWRKNTGVGSYNDWRASFGATGGGGGSGILDISNATLSLIELGSLSPGTYVLAEYGSLVGSQFAGMIGPIPAGFNLVYNHGGNKIALVASPGGLGTATVPEPGSIAILCTIGGLMAFRRRGRRAVRHCGSRGEHK